MYIPFIQRKFTINEHTSINDIYNIPGKWKRAQKEAKQKNAIAARKIGELYISQSANDMRYITNAIPWINMAIKDGDGYAPLLLAHLNQTYKDPIKGFLPGEHFTPNPSEIPSLMQQAINRKHPDSYGAYARYIGEQHPDYWTIIKNGKDNAQDDWCTAQYLEQQIREHGYSDIITYQQTTPIKNMGALCALVIGIAIAQGHIQGDPIPYVEHAAAGNIPLAQFFLGRHYIEKNINPTRGETLLKAAHQHGIQDATIFLADWKTLKPEYASHPAEPIELYWHAANHGNIAAKAVLAIRSLATTGIPGLNIDPITAQQWIEDAANNGIIIAQQWQKKQQETKLAKQPQKPIYTPATYGYTARVSYAPRRNPKEAASPPPSKGN